MAQLHSALTANHRPYAAVYADATERLAATGFVRALGGDTVAFATEDLYKKALQLDDASEWVLTAITPTWVQVSGAGSLANDSITNAKLANMAQATVKGRASGAGTGDPTDLSAAQATEILDAVVGDSGAGGTKGLVPAPAAGDAAAGKFLKADGSFAVPSGSAPGGSAGGDLAGTYPNPTVIKTSLTAAHGSDDTWTGTTVAGLNAGATIAQWEAVYLDGSSTWQLADANGTGTYPARGLATAAYVNTDPAIILVHGTVRNDAWAWTPGGTIYLSDTAGGLTQTAPSTSGDKVQQVGFALTADIAFLDFNSVFLTVT